MRLRVNWRASLGLVGSILKWLALPLSFPLLLAVYYGEPTTPFVVALMVALGVGGGLEQFRGKGNLGGREAFLMVALAWLSVAVVGAIPFLVAGNGVVGQPIDALFEAMSGITTTGATVLEDFSAHSNSMLMWRQVIQWIGGLGILVLALSVLSQLSIGGAQLMETESRTQDVHKLSPHIAETARTLWSLYAGVTALCAASLYGLHLVGMAPNMTPFMALSHAFTGVATAGFSPSPGSLGAFSAAAQWTIIPFMIIGATNFILIYYFVQGDWGRPAENEEFRFYLGVLAGTVVLVVLLLLTDPSISYPFEERLRHATFQVVSIMTTTGFATADFNTWSPAAKHVLFVLMFLGGMAGSTTCSIKLLRWLIVVKALRRDLFTAAHPDAIRPVRLSGQVVDEETIRDTYAFTLLSLLLFFGLAIFVAVDSARIGLGIDEFEALGAAAATFFNIGPAFGIAGPFDNYYPFSDATKVAMILLMWVGRIEIIPVLVLLTRSYWQS
ncbi:potassium transporter TrkH [Halalkaliarchaeum desulfuricum]|uniref:Potassium transporter TrkH n=1 Tax=Halalkaliarchaeum desulfuricum TaxID=2055893 RepID=A0A343TMD0_9EURY|nr:TrkH family potassium uptake protein [Halalkaliarchaeum desulfuricum]AUX10252.1 potassium transporter TrkH [Halalkaliarchaeum desulfuricum]